MKKRFINRLAAFILFAMMGANLFSQGFYVYTKDGQRQDYASENVDSIVFYEKAADTMEAVDLGLSVKWATCNVGASSPEEYGGYYGWGETEEKSNYYWEGYKFYNSSTGGFDYIGSNISGTQYDVAHVKWGGSWRMPTLDEIKELVNHCTWKLTTQNGVNGQLVTGPNGNSIFLPAAGCRLGTEPYNPGLLGLFWSATLYEDRSGRLHFYKDVYYCDLWLNRYSGCTVRPVTE